MQVVNVGSPNFDPCDSYGRLANELADGLTQRGWRVNRLGWKPPKQPIKRRWAACTGAIQRCTGITGRWSIGASG